MTTRLLAIICSCACVAAAGADVVSLDAARDNSMYEDFGGELSNGAGPSLFAGLTQFENRRRALIAFDLTSIPAGSTITSVTLTLTCTRSASLAEPVSLRPSLASWGEGPSIALGEGGMGTAALPGDATWRYRFYPDVLWGTEGGDLGPASATTPVAGEGAYTWSSPTMAADVQAWLANPAVNFGWAIVGNEDLPQTAKRFASRENDVLHQRPVLVVEYTPVPGPAVLGVAFSSLLSASRLRRRHLGAR
ncbi:MAG TPA: DNRLRE domain-containing protein [Phycisphaerales bacterium]|nr:DNRLRE domain-containing protein [Phycisphaerales bacterium]